MYEDLALASFLSVIDGIERIVQDASLDHNRNVVGALDLRLPRIEDSMLDEILSSVAR